MKVKAKYNNFLQIRSNLSRILKKIKIPPPPASLHDILPLQIHKHEIIQKFQSKLIKIVLPLAEQQKRNCVR